MKRHFFGFALFVILCAASSCKHSLVDPTDSCDTTGRQPHFLTGTSWNLKGIAMHGGSREYPRNEGFRLNFITDSTIRGTAPADTYSANYKDAGNSITLSNFTSSGSTHESVWRQTYYDALESATSYIFDGASSLTIVSASGATLYFENAYYVPNPPPDHIMRFGDFSTAQFLINPFQILSAARADSNHIVVFVQHDGGCAKHEFLLYTDETIQSDNTIDFAQMMITHNANNDACKALITRKLVFDVGSLLRKWRENPNRNNRLILQFSQDSSVVIEYTE